MGCLRGRHIAGLVLFVLFVFGVTEAAVSQTGKAIDDRNVEEYSKLANEIASKVEELKKSIGEVDSDIIEIEDAIILKGKKDQYATTTEHYGKELEKKDVLTFTRRKTILESLDKISTELFKIRFGTDKNFKAQNNPVKYLNDEIGHATEMLESDSMAKANRAADGDGLSLDNLERLEKAIAQFRHAQLPPPANDAAELQEQARVLAARLKTRDYTTIIGREFAETPERSLTWNALISLRDAVADELVGEDKKERLAKLETYEAGLLKKLIDRLATAKTRLNDGQRSDLAALAESANDLLLDHPDWADLAKEDNPIGEDLNDIAKVSDKLAKTLGLMRPGQELAFLGEQMFTNKTLPDSLESLEQSINELLKGVAATVIRIEQATVGDTFGKSYADCLNMGTGTMTSDCAMKAIKRYRNNWKPSRWCDASELVRQACNGKEECEFGGENSKPLPIDYAARLCGYNPAPTARPQHRGLHVFYYCVRKETRAFVAATPSDRNAVSSSDDPQVICDAKSPDCMDGGMSSLQTPAVKLRYALLRRGGQLSCSFR